MGFAWWCTVLLHHSCHFSLTLIHLIHEYHDDFPWNSVPLCGFCGTTEVAKKESYDVLFIVVEHVMLLSECCRVCRHCCHLCVPCSAIAISLALLWSFQPRRICPACPCRHCCQRLAVRASLWTTTTTMTPRASLVFWRAEHPKHQLHHVVFIVLVVPTCLHHHCCWCHPPEMPLLKLVYCDLQEIACVLSRFCVGVVIVLHPNAVAIVDLPILPPNVLKS